MTAHLNHGDWCSNKPIEVSWFTKEKKGYRDKRIPKWVRCPKCNRRLKPHTEDCEDMHKNDPRFALNKVDKGGGVCIHVFIPAHKRK